ncbi:MAG: hypothetical protein KC549_13635 [Myxococcales bacterium]|nr:hypothetical protein [Myxococcales bacterium]
MIRYLMPLALAPLFLAGCGGRAGLSEESGNAFKRMWQAQADSQPRDKLAPMTAAEASIVMGNHSARYDKGKGGAGSKFGGGGLSGAGLLTPATTDLSALGLGGDSDGGGGPGDRQIRLQAK